MFSICPSCGQKFRVLKSGIFLCPHCNFTCEIKYTDFLKNKIVIQGELFDEFVTVEESRKIPLESNLKSNYAIEYFKTLKLILRNPSLFFSIMEKNGNEANAVIYGLVILSISNILSIMVGYFTGNNIFKSYFFVTTKFLPSYNENSILIPALSILFIPIIAIIWIYSRALVYHIMLYIVQENVNFSLTLKIVSYGPASANILRFIPILGRFISLLFEIYITIVGLNKVLHISRLKASIVVIIPLLVLLMLLLLIWIIIFQAQKIQFV